MNSRAVGIALKLKFRMWHLMRSARESATRLLQLMMIAAVVLPAALFIYAAWVSYREFHDVADERIGRSLIAVYAHTCPPLACAMVALRVPSDDGFANHQGQVTGQHGNGCNDIEKHEFHEPPPRPVHDP